MINSSVYTRRKDNCMCHLVKINYNGKTIKGVAVCSPEDSYDASYGYKLARARCLYRLAEVKAKDFEKEKERLYAEYVKALDKYTRFLDKFADKVDRELEFSSNELARIEREKE